MANKPSHDEFPKFDKVFFPFWLIFSMACFVIWVIFLFFFGLTNIK